MWTVNNVVITQNDKKNVKIGQMPKDQKEIFEL